MRAEVSVIQSCFIQISIISTRAQEVMFPRFCGSFVVFPSSSWNAIELWKKREYKQHAPGFSWVTREDPEVTRRHKDESVVVQADLGLTSSCVSFQNIEAFIC
jgi:hypothetical protein